MHSVIGCCFQAPNRSRITGPSRANIACARRISSKASNAVPSRSSPAESVISYSSRICFLIRFASADRAGFRAFSRSATLTFDSGFDFDFDFLVSVGMCIGADFGIDSGFDFD